MSSTRISLLLIVPLVTAFAALVKDTHGFIGAANLHLHKVGLIVIALTTNGHGPIDIFPSRRPTQNVVDLFATHALLDGPIIILAATLAGG